MKRLRVGKITFRLVAVMLLICLVPIGILAAFFEREYSTGVEQRAVESAEKLLYLIDNIAREEMGKISYLSDVLAMSEVVQQNLDTAAPARPFQLKDILSMNAAIDEMYSISAMIKSISVFSQQGETLFGTGYHFLSQQDQAALVTSIEAQAPMDYITSGIFSQGSECIAFCRAINSKERYNKRIGYLVITINEDVFSKKVFDGVESARGDVIFAYAPNQQIVTSNVGSLPVGAPMPPEIAHAIEQGKQAKLPYFQVTTGGTDYIGTTRYSTTVGWTQVLLTSQAPMRLEQATMARNILLMAILCSLAAAVCVIAVSQTIIVPLKHLIAYVKQSETASPVAFDDTARDEIGYLARHTEMMVQQRRQMEAQHLEEQREQHLQELRLLQAQISPHFLFNILNNFKWIAALNEVPALEKGITCLAQLLRSTIMSTDEFIPLQTEIGNLEHYCYIQSLIHPGRLVFEAQVDAALREVPVPKLLLQPIMENSILHGLRQNGAVLHLCLEATQEGQYCCLRMRDDGEGCDSKSVLQKDVPDKMNHIGVENIRRRVALLYGAQGSFLFESVTGQGTVVTIQLPLHKEELPDVSGIDCR